MRSDAMNDYREGHNAMAGLSFTGYDARGYFRVAIFGYTRRDVGDWLQRQH